MFMDLTVVFLHAVARCFFSAILEILVHPFEHQFVGFFLKQTEIVLLTFNSIVSPKGDVLTNSI